MARACIYRGQTARNGGFGVIMGMNAQTIPRHARGDYRPRDLAYFIRQSAAIRIAQNDPPRPRRMRRVNGGQGIIWVGLIAIKEMFCVKQRLAPCGHEMGDGGADIFKVLFKADPKRLGHMEIMGFAHQTNRSRARIHHARQNIIIRGRAACAFGHTKGRHGRARVRHRFEKGTVRGVGAGPAPFDIIHTQIIEHRSNTQLVLGGELHPLGLLPVPQGGVIEIEAIAGHVAPHVLPAQSACSARTAPPRGGRSSVPKATHKRPSNFNGSKFAVGINSTPSLLIRTSTPASVRADFRASTGPKSFVSIAV